MKKIVYISALSILVTTEGVNNVGGTRGLNPSPFQLTHFPIGGEDVSDPETDSDTDADNGPTTLYRLKGIAQQASLDQQAALVDKRKIIKKAPPKNKQKITKQALSEMEQKIIKQALSKLAKIKFIQFNVPEIKLQCNTIDEVLKDPKLLKFDKINKANDSAPASRLKQWFEARKGVLQVCIEDIRQEGIISKSMDNVFPKYESERSQPIDIDGQLRMSVIAQRLDTTVEEKLSIFFDQLSRLISRYKNEPELSPQINDLCRCIIIAVQGNKSDVDIINVINSNQKQSEVKDALKKWLEDNLSTSAKEIDAYKRLALVLNAEEEVEEEVKPIKIQDFRLRGERIKQVLTEKGFKLKTDGTLDICIPQNIVNALKLAFDAVYRDTNFKEIFTSLVIVDAEVSALRASLNKFSPETNDKKSIAGVLISLSNVIKPLKNKKDKNVPGYFMEFLESARAILSLSYAHCCEENVERIRRELKSGQQQTNWSMNFDVDIPGAPGLKFYFGADGRLTCSTDSDTSLVTVDKNTKGRAGVAYNFGIGDVQAGADAYLTNSYIFYSIAAYLDYLLSDNASKLEVTQAKQNSAIGIALDGRKKLQQAEEQVVRVYASFAQMLKLFQVIPIDAAFSPLMLTKAKVGTGIQADEIGGGLEAQVQVSAAVAGIDAEFAVHTGIKNYVSVAPLLSYLNKDCSVRTSYKDLQQIIGIEKFPNRYAKKLNWKKGFKDNLYTVLDMIKTLDGDLSQYNGYLVDLEKNLSDENKNRIARLKKNFERTNFGRPNNKAPNGRQEVFNVAVLTAIMYRQSFEWLCIKKAAEIENSTIKKENIRGITHVLDIVKKDPVIRARMENIEKLFMRIYNKLYDLAQLCALSKNTKGWRKFFKSRAKDKVYSEIKAVFNDFSLTGTAEVLGQEFSASLQGRNMKGSPIDSDNGTSITFNYEGSRAFAGALQKIREWFIKADSRKKLPDEFTELKSVMDNLTSDSLDALINGITGLQASVKDRYGVEIVFNEAASTDTNDKPVPGINKLLKKPNKKFILYSATAYKVNDIKGALEVDGLPVSAELSVSDKTSRTLTGNDTLQYLCAKYGTFCLVNGIEDEDIDSEEVVKNKAVDDNKAAFLKMQEAQLQRIFYRIGAVASDAPSNEQKDYNVAVELQSLYNQLLSSTTETAEASIADTKKRVAETLEDTINSFKSKFSKDTFLEGMIADLTYISELLIKKLDKAEMLLQTNSKDTLYVMDETTKTIDKDIDKRLYTVAHLSPKPEEAKLMMKDIEKISAQVNETVDNVMKEITEKGGVQRINEMFKDFVECCKTVYKNYPEAPRLLAVSRKRPNVINTSAFQDAVKLLRAILDMHFEQIIKQQYVKLFTDGIKKLDR